MKRVRSKAAAGQANWRLFQTTRQVLAHTRSRLAASSNEKVVFFNASTRLTGMSLNAAFHYLAACGLQLGGVPVVYFACRAGMSRCVLGTDRDNPANPPPCRECQAQSGRLFAHAPVVWFAGAEDERLARSLNGLDLDALSSFEYPLPAASRQLPVNYRPALRWQTLAPVPLGRLVMPALRWTLRRHHLADDEATLFLLRSFIQSAYRVATEFAGLLAQTEPAAAVIFNGIMFPEAAAQWVAQQLKVRVVTHEVGFQPFSAFFTDGQATAYPIHIPAGFELTAEQNVRLEAYLSRRFQGEFTMAGIRFWPEMRGLDAAFAQKAAKMRQIVPVFTNVVYDTSQVHANVVFPDMFAWLDLMLEIIRAHPDTLFVIRAHPDEMRPGTRKQSRESVQAWVSQKAAAELPNVVFIDSQEYVSSYELIRQSKFVCVYNSSIGLEAALLGAPVLCGGKARYTQYPIVFFPDTMEGYRQQAEAFLTERAPIQVPPEFSRNARNFIYNQLYRASLPFGDFLEDHPRPGFVQLRAFNWEQLTPEQSPTIGVLVDGILHGKPFLNVE